MYRIVSGEEISTNQIEILQHFSHLLSCKDMDDILEDGNTLKFHWKKLFHFIFLDHPSQFKDILFLVNLGGPGSPENNQFGSLIAESLKDVCDNDSVEFLNTLSKSPYNTLKLITYDHNNWQVHNTSKCTAWLFLGEWLCKHIASNPKAVIINILSLTADQITAEASQETQYGFVPCRFLLLFGRNSKQLFDIFANEYNLKFEEEEKTQKVLYGKARHIAQNMLREFSDSNFEDFFQWLKEEKYKNDKCWSQDKFAQL